MKSTSRLFFITFLILIIQQLIGCGGLNSFPLSARAGDTVALTVGWKQEFSRDKITIIFEPDNGAPSIVYQPNHSSVQASVNLYADPVSFMAVGYETNRSEEEFNYASTYGTVVNGYTNQDPDWWQTTLIINLPPELPLGTTNITITSNGSAGESYGPIPVEIIGGVGKVNALAAQGLATGMTAAQRHVLERAPHYVVNFASKTIPFGIQADFIHDTDLSNGGTGRAYIVNPRGDIKSVNWKDDGENLRVLLMPARDKVLSKMNRFKFYVSGGVTGLALANLKAFDVNGNAITGVTATIQ